MAALKSIFKEVEVPEPIDFFATKWGKEEFSQMSYSYVKIGASGFGCYIFFLNLNGFQYFLKMFKNPNKGADYDILAEPHSERVLFAGEATNRHFPQTGYFSSCFLSQKIFK